MRSVRHLYVEAKERPVEHTLPTAEFKNRNALLNLIIAIGKGRGRTDNPYINGGRRVETIDDAEALAAFDELYERFRDAFPTRGEGPRGVGPNTFDVSKREAELLLLAWESMPYMAHGGVREHEYEDTVIALEDIAGRDAVH